MIQIHVDPNYNAFIWNAQDWHELRSRHHIVGNLIGTRCSAAKNTKILSLPCQLLPEEVTLLVEENICQLVQSKNSTESLSTLKERFDSYKEKIKKEQVQAFRKGKEKKILSMIDTIAKNREALVTSKDPVNKTQILHDELNKIQPLSEDHVLIQRFLEDQWTESDKMDPKHWPYPESRKDKLKCSIFKDLWCKGYFITNGNKFGGDYLVYTGDPSKFHAQYIVICKHHSETFQAAELAMYGRVGSNAKKTVVIASSDSNGKVVYQSLSWADLVT